MDLPKTSNGDPFEQEPLPKAFYHPSMPKDLNENERKTCLSPERKKEKDQVSSAADKRFLHQSNTIHEIPTRENGIAADESSSTQFNESWPSTERPSTVALTPETVADSTNETLKSSETQGWPDLTQISLPDSTLARYIYRFRHSVPSSRQTRDRVYMEKGKDGEFWWLSSSPDSSSTPRQSTPLQGQFPVSKSVLSPKMKKKSLREKEGMSPSLTPLSHKMTSGPSTLASSVEGMDTPTKIIQKKAKELIDKSESTLDLSSPSSSSQQLERVISQKTEDGGTREKHIKKHAKRYQERQYQAPPLSPEEDILYQWRLARKMEKAQEQAAQSGSASNIASLRPVLSTKSNLMLGKEPFCQTGNITSRGPMSYPPVVTDHKRLMTSAIAASAPIGVPSNSGPTPVGLNCPNTIAVTTVTSSHPTGMLPTTTPLPLQSEETIHHTNMVPCLPHESLPQPGRTPCGAVFSAEGVVRSSLVAAPSPLSAATATTLTTPSTVTTAVLSNPVAHPGSLTLHDTECKTHLSHYVPNKQYSTVAIPPHMHLSCDIISCPHDVRGSLESMELPLALPVHNHNHSETGLHGRKSKTKKDSRVPTSKHGRAAGENEIKKKTRSPIKHSQDIQMNDLYTKDSDVRRDSELSNVDSELGVVKHQETQLDESSKPGNKRVVGNVIGQVISERLFPSPDLSPPSDESSMLPTASNQDFGSDEAEISDESLSDDEIIRVLQEKMQCYKRELRQIDKLLSDLATR